MPIKLLFLYFKNTFGIQAAYRWAKLWLRTYQGER